MQTFFNGAASPGQVEAFNMPCIVLLEIYGSASLVFNLEHL